MLEFILMLGKKLQDADARRIVEKGFEALEDCDPRRGLHVAIEVGVGEQDESAAQV